MRFLVTGFGPFEGVADNPTERIARYFEQNPEYNGAEVDGRVFEVTMEDIKKVPKMLDRGRYAAALHFGVNTYIDCINVERVALNVDDFRLPDNKGAQPVDRPIRRGGENALFATLPLRAIISRLEGLKVPVKMSNTAGTYLCNHLMYESLYHIRKHRLRTLSGFVHVPPLEKVGAEDQLRAAKAILDVLMEKRRK